MSREPPSTDDPIRFEVILEKPGRGLIAEADGVVLLVDLHGTGLDGAHVLIEGLARQRKRRPRPQVVVAISIVGEAAPDPSAPERAIARHIGEHCSSFVGVIEGNGIRARWVRGVISSVSRFAPRRTPIFVARAIAEGAAIAARELRIEAAPLAASLDALRARAARGA